MTEKIISETMEWALILILFLIIAFFVGMAFKDKIIDFFKNIPGFKMVYIILK